MRPVQNDPLKAIDDARTVGVRFDTEQMHVDLADGRTISVPLSWFPRLYHAQPSAREGWRLIGDGDGISWEALDEDISVRGLLPGRRAPEETPPCRSFEIQPQPDDQA